MSKGRLRDQKLLKEGFTLVELMVVVTIIGIIASIAIPKMIGYIRRAETTEPSTIMAHIASNFMGNMSTKTSLTTAYSALSLAVNSATNSNQGGLLPFVEDRLPSGNQWSYALWATVSTGTVTGICMQALALVNGAQTSNYILYAAGVTDTTDWDVNTGGNGFWKLEYMNQDNSQPTNTPASCPSGTYPFTQGN